LLCLGMGKLSEWSRNCSLLPFAFEAIWTHFEYIAAARYSSVSDLNEMLQLVQAPEALWRQYYTQAHGQNRLCEIDCNVSENLPQDLCFFSDIVATSDNGAPTAVFIGELANRIAVAMIDDTLKPADFSWLWSLQPDHATVSRITT